MVILRTRNKITDFLMILAWASPFNCMVPSSDKTKNMVIGTRKRLQYLDVNKYKLIAFLGKSKIKQVTEEKLLERLDRLFFINCRYCEI